MLSFECKKVVVIGKHFKRTDTFYYDYHGASKIVLFIHCVLHTILDNAERVLLHGMMIFGGRGAA